MTSKSQYVKENDTLDLIKMKNICSSKDMVKSLKRQATDWKKILANHISGRELEVRIYRIAKFRAGRVPQVVEHLSSKREALSSNPSAKKKQNKKTQYHKKSAQYN
jgi:hypothetical protein